MFYVNRTCTEMQEDEQIRQANHSSTQLLSAYENLSAYVLLGDPGAGKTEAFKREAERLGAEYVTARDLITFEDRPEWHDQTLFIDGLDEIRAGTQDARTHFDAIRARLDQLGCPCFRLSCREADWFGSTDQNHLTSVSPDDQVKILHLDPLIEADIDEILIHDSRVPSAKAFVLEAENRGLSGLLVNPQVLDLLVEAVAGGDWPATKQQTFEMACRTIIREYNQQHIVAKRSQSNAVDHQLNAAGFLCALQLIAGNAGFSLPPAEAGRDFPDTNDLAFENSGLLAEVGRTKLFKSLAGNRVAPIHRHIAEFLAARYLAKRIEQDGLPVGRVLALITGEDGIVVAELRGLSAWLAAFCKSQRHAIIERDPLGVVLYGDVQKFTREEKRQVLDGLQREAEHFSGFRSWRWATSPFGALATEDMASEFHEILAVADRSETHQALAACVLDAMIHGERLPSINDTIYSIVRDSTWRPGLRRQALQVLVHTSKDSPDQLKVLLNEINEGKVADAADELAGYLLAELYPQKVTPNDVLQFLHAPSQRNYFGEYLLFWHCQLVDQSADSDVRVLLDELASQLDSLRPIIDDHLFSDLTTGLLARGLNECGASTDFARLYDWLGVGLDKYGSPREGPEKYTTSIRSWLEANPDVQKGVLSIGLDKCSASNEFSHCIRKAWGRLFRAGRPAGFGLWCLEQMQLATNEQAARYLLQNAVNTICYRIGDDDLTLEVIQEIAERKSRDKDWLSGMLVCPLDSEEGILFRRCPIAEQDEEKQRWLRVVKSRKAELDEGKVHPHLLHALAVAYFGNFIESKGDSPLERLRNFLDHDEELVQCVIKGLRRSLERDDIPTVADIIKLDSQRKVHLVGRPFLAGLEELNRISPDCVNRLTDIQIKQAVAFYLVDGASEQPGWFKSLLHSHPQLVAEVLTAYVTAAFRSKKEQIAGVYALAYFDEYKSVARLAALEMLKAFPVRSTNQQLSALNLILRAAVCNADIQVLSTLIEKKIKPGSMNVAQRVSWLAAGVIAAPEKYLQSLADFTKAQESRVRHLAYFLTARHDQWLPFDQLPVAALDLLIRRIGGFFAPYELDGGGTWSPEMNASELVFRLISQLGSRAESEATYLLEALSADGDLHRWHAALQRAQFEQRAVRREASFRHPDIHQVNATLNQLEPANAGDLAALTMHVLHELADRIRNGNTNDYRQFWDEGQNRELVSPRHEEACREALLSDLQYRFEKLGIDAQPEGYYADNKRADIRVSFNGTNGFEVPIEIKKNSHRDLWRAIHDQLIAKYTREPRAHGFGIYLVFWFGYDKTPPAPNRPRPRTAEELEKRLHATLSVDETRKISVCVIDVAKPD